MQSDPKEYGNRERLKNAVIAIKKLQAQLESAERRQREPIAVIGMGCHFPGGASDPESYWQLLRDGRDGTSEIPAWRWPVDEFYSDDPDAPGRMYTRRGGFVEGIETFDADFFGISPREALRIDPQQRVLLEVTWEALEDAGLAPDNLLDSNTGVFIGITGSDYGEVVRSAGSQYLDAYHLTGCCPNFGPGRIAYLLGLRGPALAIDTACSSSLVAVDSACRSLRTGQCDLALAGGTNALLIPDTFVTTCKARMLAVDGRCKTFDAAANGYARAEGSGVVVLKRLADAQRDNDRILALILGSAVNQDGKSSGLTVPNRHAQEDVIRQALEFAGVSPCEVQYVEAHGTGTPLGDPIEVRALANVLGQGRSLANPFFLASVKTNIGHLESAAGIAGLIKVVLALRHGQIPPHLNLHNPTPHVQWNEIPVRVPTTLTPWSAGTAQRLAGISSFGASGTNSHVVVGQAPEAATLASAPQRPLHLLTVSARTDAALQAALKRLDDHLGSHPEASIQDVCHTANAGRSHFPSRVSVLCTDILEAREKLRDCFSSPLPGGVMVSRVSGRPRPRIAFLFTGQGSQYIGMGRQLFESSPVFRAAIERCADALRPHLEHPLLSVIFPADTGSTLINETRYTQPALFALEYALSELWRSWGIEPSFVLGHSVGEYVAACVAGVFSLDDSLRLIAERARLMQAEPSGGRMVAVRASEEQVRTAMALFSRTVSVAAINGPRNVVISGVAAHVEAVAVRLAAQSVHCQDLTVSHAFHSPLMEPMLAAFEAVVGKADLQAPRIRLVSNVTGRIADPKEITRTDYWRRHVREPVRFAQGMQTLVEEGCRVFLELGPSPVLLGMARQSIEASDALWLSTLRPNGNDWAESLGSLQALYHAGAAIDWKGLDRDYAHRKISLPTYPFQRERFWVESEGGARHPRSGRPIVDPGNRHPLAGVALSSPAIEGSVFETVLSARQPLYLMDHQACGRVILPAAAYVEMALAAARQLFGESACRVDDLILHEALVLELDAETKVQLIFRSSEGNADTFEVFSNSAERERPGTWVRHAVGRVSKTAEGEQFENKAADFEAIRNRCAESVDIKAYYERLGDQGPKPGPAFSNLCTLLRGNKESLAEIRLPESPVSTDAGYCFHPALLDACLQTAAQATVPASDAVADDEVLLPIGIECVRVIRDAPNTLWSHARLRSTSDHEARTFVMDLAIFDQHGDAVGSVAGFKVKRVHRSRLEDGRPESGRDWLFEVQWRKMPPTRTVATEGGHRLNRPGTWLILADEQGVGETLRAQLAKLGQKSVLAKPGSAFLSQGENQYLVNPANRADMARLVEESGITPAMPLRGVVHLWSLNSAHFDRMSADDLARAQLLGCGAALHLVHALVSLKMEPAPRLWLVTRGVQAVTESSMAVHAAMAALWGLGRVIAAEHPELGCQRIDLDPEDQDADALFEVLCHGESNEGEIAFRHKAPLTPRLVVSNPAPQGSSSALPKMLPLRSDGSYLVTGGFGGLGLETARWMAQQGARNLILMGRREPGPDAKAVLDDLARHGVKIAIENGDVSDEAQLIGIISRIAKSMPPLRGIIHAAGVLDDGVLLQQTWPRFERVMAPKVQGAWNLHRLTLSHDLDFFVLFSAAAAVIGSPGQGNYAAANAFMDALAHQRKAMGVPALSINWGPWSGVGMAARLDTKDSERWRNRGMRPIALDRGMRALGEMLGVSRAQVVAMPVDWSRFLASSSLGQSSAFFAEVSPESQKAADSSPLAGDLVARLSAEPPVRRLAVLEELVESAASRALGIVNGKPLDPRRPLHEMGLDSLMSVELRNALAAPLRRTLPSTLLFDYPTIESLAWHLAKDVLNLELAAGRETPDAAAAASSDWKDLDALTESEAEALLLAELDRAGQYADE
jgi:acyl transferase domain-containing protein